MNHITRLTVERDEANAKLQSMAEQIESFRVHLLSAKFQGVDTDGDRKDWIATADVLRRLSDMQSAL